MIIDDNGRIPSAQEILYSGACEEDEVFGNYFYHATPTKLIKRIMKHGLKPGSGKGSHFMGMEDWSQGKIFLSQGLENGTKWQMMLAEETGLPIGLLEIRLTDEQIKKLELDTVSFHEDDMCSFYLTFSVAPSQIKVVDWGEINEGFSVARFQKLAGILKEGKKGYDEVQSDLFRGSGVNGTTDFEEKIPKFVQYMKKNGWGRMPPVRGGYAVVDKQDLEQYEEAAEGGYEHELDWSRPLTRDDLGMEYAHITDGHNRAWAAHYAKIPIRIKRF